MYNGISVILEIRLYSYSLDTPVLLCCFKLWASRMVSVYLYIQIQTSQFVNPSNFKTESLTRIKTKLTES